MSKTISENQDAWGKKSWINDFTNDKVLQANLTDEYAHDVLEAVAEGYFPTLDSAIAELSLRTGLTASEAGVIKTAAVNLVRSADAEVVIKEEEDVPGNKEDVAGDRLVKESPAEASANEEIKTANDKVCDECGKIKNFCPCPKEDKMEKDHMDESCSVEDKKEASTEADKTAAVDNKEAWFQGADQPTVEGDVTTNDPEKLGYPDEMGYPKKPMETTAPGGQDSRPYEEMKYKEEAEMTKKVMGPKGKEFEEKVEMQRIPKGEKPANASAKRLGLIASIVKADKK